MVIHTWCYKLILEELCTVGVTPQGENSGKLVSGFLQTLARVPFFCAGFVLYPFTVINLMFGPVSVCECSQGTAKAVQDLVS